MYICFMRIRAVFLAAVIFFGTVCTFFAEGTLLFGNPDGARADAECREIYLLEKKQYVLSYNASLFIPNWVTWHLCSSDLGECSRGNDFRPDGQLPDGFYAVKKSDYQYKIYGFDRGHICPSADRTASKEDNSATFLMTNMIPQAPDCNRIVWKDLESFERSLAQSGKELYIMAGPCGKGGTGAAGYFEKIELPSSAGENLSINVPAFCWKIILVLDEGEDDLSRVTEETPVIAVFIPNVQRNGADSSWEDYLTSVDYIEEMTEYDFFTELSDEIEKTLEAGIYNIER